MKRTRISWLAVVVFAGCATAQSATTPQREMPAARSVEGVQFEVLRPRATAFQLALITLVQFGIPITEASEANGTILTGQYRFDGVVETRYRIVVSGTDTIARVSLKGWYDAPTLGVANAPIGPVEFGYQAKLWKHFARLAHSIETQRLGHVIPEENIHRSNPE